MAATSPGYGITIRVEGPPSAQPVALATTVITDAGATITALDVVESLLEKVVLDITCDTIDSAHADQITIALAKNPELTVRKVSDRTFLLHLGGKIEIQSKVPLKTRDDLSRAYTPGVARICQAIVAEELLEIADIPLPEDDDESSPIGNLEILADLGMNGMEISALCDDAELFPDEQLEAIANRLGFGDQFAELLEL